MRFDNCDDETLIEMYRVGNEAAFEVLVERYKYLVRKKAKAMYIAGGDSDDLIQEGMLGLFKAVKDFDETRDVTFSSFASMCVNRQIMTAVTISNRKKNSPLNSYVSFNTPLYSEDEYSDMHYVDIMTTQREKSPEDIYIENESADNFRTKLDSVLSRYERIVFGMYLQGIDYIEIAEPVGIIAGVTPVTNPTSTTMFKSIISAKTRNVIIFENSPIVHFFIFVTSCLYSCCSSQSFRYFCFYFRKDFLHFRIFDFWLNTFQQGKTLLIPLHFFQQVDFMYRNIIIQGNTTVYKHDACIFF